MKLLVSNHSVTGIGGSESHARTLAAEFIRLGHDVTLCDTREIPTGKSFDAAFLSQYHTVEHFFNLCPDFPKEKVVQTVHGLIPQERPHPGCKHVAVSRELSDKYGIDKIILNPVDLDIFRPVKDLPLRQRRVLSLCQSDDMNRLLATVCRERGLELICRNKLSGVTTKNIQLEMQIADIVVTIGRGVYEAMACGAAVLIADHRPYQKAMGDGWAVDCYGSSVKQNCSGRAHGINPDLWYLKSQIALYADHNHWQGRDIAEKYHDVKRAAVEYLDLII